MNTRMLVLKHYDPVTQIFVSEFGHIGSVKGFWPMRHQAINWTNCDLLAVGASEAKFFEMWNKIRNFVFKKMLILEVYTNTIYRLLDCSVDIVDE